MKFRTAYLIFVLFFIGCSIDNNDKKSIRNNNVKESLNPRIFSGFYSDHELSKVPAIPSTPALLSIEIIESIEIGLKLLKKNFLYLKYDEIKRNMTIFFWVEAKIMDLDEDALAIEIVSNQIRDFGRIVSVLTMGYDYFGVDTISFVILRENSEEFLFHQHTPFKKGMFGSFKEPSFTIFENVRYNDLAYHINFKKSVIKYCEKYGHYHAPALCTNL